MSGREASARELPFSVPPLQPGRISGPQTADDTHAAKKPGLRPHRRSRRERMRIAPGETRGMGPATPPAVLQGRRDPLPERRARRRSGCRPPASSADVLTRNHRTHSARLRSSHRPRRRRSVRVGSLARVLTWRQRRHSSPRGPLCNQCLRARIVKGACGRPAL